MNKEVEELFKTLNLTRFNVKKLTDFDRIQDVLIQVSNESRPALLDKIFIAACRGKNLGIIDFLRSFAGYEPASNPDFGKVYQALDAIFSRFFHKDYPTATIAKDLWNAIGPDEQYEVISLFFLSADEAPSQEIASQIRDNLIGGLGVICSQEQFDQLVPTLVKAHQGSYFSNDEGFTEEFTNKINAIAHSPVFHYQDIMRIEPNTQIQKIKGVTESIVRHIENLASQGKLSNAGSVISNELARSPLALLDIVTKVNVEDLVRPSNHRLMTTLLHSDWIEEMAPLHRAQALNVMERVIMAPAFASLAAEKPSLHTLQARYTSLKTCEILRKHGYNPILPHGRFGEDVDSIRSILRSGSKLTQSEADALDFMARKLPQIKSLVNIYNDNQLEGVMSLADVDDDMKIELMSFYGVYETSLPASSKEPRRLKDTMNRYHPKGGDPLFMLKEIFYLLSRNLTDQQKISIAPKNKDYIKALIDIGQIDKEKHIKLLGASQKRQLLSKDMGI